MDNKEKLEQSKANLKRILAKNPSLKQAFRETLDEMSNPENVKKMASEIHGAIKEFAVIKECLKEKRGGN